MAALEDELRASLARQVAGAPAPSSSAEVMADQAIRGARSLRRRQRLGGAATAFALAVLVGLSLVYLPERENHPVVAEPSVSTALAPAAEHPSTAVNQREAPSRPQAKAREVARLPVDVVVDHRLVTVDGRWIDVSFAGTVSTAYRVAAGWLVVGVPKAADHASLWLLSATGRRQVLLSGVDGLAIDSSGHRLAWRAGSRLWLGALAGRTVSRIKDAVVAGNALPVSFVGDAVLLSDGRPGGVYELWWPHRGVYHSAYASAAMEVYGGLSDGRTAVGQVVVDADAVLGGEAVDGQRCLALFDASRALTLLKTLCGLGPAAKSPGWVSPDGRWLLTRVTGRTVLVNLKVTGDRPRVVGADPPTHGSVAWLDEQTVVLSAGAGTAVVRLRLDDRTGKAAEDDVEQFPVPGIAKDSAPDDPVLVVPRL